MRKGWIVLLTAVLVVAFAAPAMADLKVTGFYRAKSMLSNFFDGRSAPSIRTDAEEQTNAYVEQRARIKFDVGAENVRAVFHFESDMMWGFTSGSVNRNEGGALSADSVQLETKEVYVWFKIPDTSIQAKVGMQSVNDHYAGIFSNAADMAGIFVNGQAEPVKWTFGWAKLYEQPLTDARDTDGDGVTAEVTPDGFNTNDDADLYLVAAEFVPTKDMTLGLNFYYLADDTGKGGFGAALVPQGGIGPGGALNNRKVDIYMPGVNFGMNAGPMKLSAFAFYQFGTLESTIGQPDVDVNAYMLDLRGDMKVGPGNLFLEGFWISGGDGSNPTEYESPITLGDYQATRGGTGGNAGFGRTNMYFLFGADSLNVSQCLIGCSGGELGDSFGNNGRGLYHLAAGYSQKFSEKVRGAVNIGYAAAVDTFAVDTVAGGSGLRADRDNGIGTEFNARVDYSISKGLDFSLVGAYLLLGDFIQNDAGAPEFNDTYYMGYARIFYAF
jgi:hypothetical protein